MFSRVSTRMAAENGAEVAMEEGNERFSEIQVETLEKKAKWNMFNWPGNRSSTAFKKNCFALSYQLTQVTTHGKVTEI